MPTRASLCASSYARTCPYFCAHVRVYDYTSACTRACLLACTRFDFDRSAGQVYPGGIPISERMKEEQTHHPTKDVQGAQHRPGIARAIMHEPLCDYAIHGWAEDDRVDCSVKPCLPIQHLPAWRRHDGAHTGHRDTLKQNRHDECAETNVQSLRQSQ